MEPAKIRRPGTFTPETRPNVGRVRGVRNKITRDIKEGLINSAIKHGSDSRGKDGLEGYFDFLLVADLRAHSQLMGKLIPYMVNANVTSIAPAINIIPVPTDRYLSADDIRALDPSAEPPLVIDNEPEPA